MIHFKKVELTSYSLGSNCTTGLYTKPTFVGLFSLNTCRCYSVDEGGMMTNQYTFYSKCHATSMFFLPFRTILMDRDHHVHSKHITSNILPLLIYIRMCLFHQYGFQYTIQITMIQYRCVCVRCIMWGAIRGYWWIDQLTALVESVHFYPRSR